jgi:hypothetical protein
MIIEGTESVAANVAFGLVVLLSFALLILSVMFFLLALRGCWRWLCGHTWSDVLASAERKALK